jgi:DAK2 domain fusion protein YloV
LKYTTIDGQLLKEMLLNAAYELENNKAMVNALNVFPVPDGDTGTNMSATIMSAANEIKNVKDVNIQSIADAAAMGSLMGARGNSGVILSQLLRGFSKYLKNKKTITTKDFALALQEGVNTAYRAVMKPTEGTILTVARESAEKAVKLSKSEDDFLNFMKGVYEHASFTLNRTPEMLPVLKQAGVVDAGGKGLLCIYHGILKRLQGEIISLGVESTPIETAPHQAQSGIDKEDIKFGYCTEFFIKTKGGDPDKFKEKILKYGDSIVVVGTEELIKVHIHTNNPGAVLEEAIKLGELSKIKIDNMREQHRNLTEGALEEEKSQPQTSQEEKEYGIVTVAMGDGITNIFKDLGVDIVIEGGQTMNPSTHDILNAINSVNAKNVFVLPNNKNIIMAAEQARDISDKNVIVIGTKSIPQGVTAVISFNPDLTPEENVSNMNKAIERVKTGQVTYAVRNTVFNDVEIKEGNILGIYNGKLIKAGEDTNEVTKELLDSMIDENSELITVFYGNDIKEEDTVYIQDYISKKYPQCDVSFNYGGQPLYYYIISVE